MWCLCAVCLCSISLDFPHPSKSVGWLPRHLLINPSVCELRASRAHRAPARQLAHGPTSWDLSPQKNLGCTVCSSQGGGAVTRRRSHAHPLAAGTFWAQRGRLCVARAASRCAASRGRVVAAQFPPARFVARAHPRARDGRNARQYRRHDRRCPGIAEESISSIHARGSSAKAVGSLAAASKRTRPSAADSADRNEQLRGGTPLYAAPPQDPLALARFVCMCVYYGALIGRLY